MTNVVDCRWQNFLIGSAEAWYDYPAGGDVDMADHGMGDLGGLKLGDPAHAEVTVGGAITYSALFMEVEGNGGAADDLYTITYAGADQRLLFLVLYPGSGDVTVRTGEDNIELDNTDCVLTGHLMLGLIYRDSAWREVFRTNRAPTYMSADLECAYHALIAVGRLNLGAAVSKTITTGAITVTDRNSVQLLNEDSDPTDELDTINGAGGTSGDLLILMSQTDVQVPTIKHGTGNIILANGRDCELSTTKHRLTLHHNNTLAKWVEVTRSHRSLFDLTGTGAGILWQPSWYIPETLAQNTTYPLEVYVHQSLTIVDFAVRVTTAPGVGGCVVHIKDNGVSIGAATIANGEYPASWGTVITVLHEPDVAEFRGDDEGRVCLWPSGEPFYVFRASDGTIRHARISPYGVFDEKTERPRGVPKSVNTFHSWVVDVLPTMQHSAE